MSTMTRREFIKKTSMATLAFAATASLPIEKVFAADDCAVKTRYGTFNGFVDKNGVKTWLGIPFAEPPVGKLRWQAPQKLKPTDKTFDAKKFGASPMQERIKIVDFMDYMDADKERPPQSEDCLTLNIWARSNNVRNKPVMVFIYGGAFLEGASIEYKGANFVSAQDVVLVTFNYRLNVFGFMNFGAIDPAFEDSGCLGLQDQVAALAWVKENIAAFGGDPDNITVFGESAGSISTMLLTVAPSAKGLFQKAIPQSGHVAFHGDGEISAQYAENFMAFSGSKTVGGLMKKSAVELQELSAKLTTLQKGSNFLEFFPMCDGKFLPRNPIKVLKDGAARGIKFLTGTTADEWRAFLAGGETFFDVFREKPEQFSTVLRRYKAQTPQGIYRKWLGGRPDTYDSFADFVTQVDWRVGQELTSEYQSKFDDVYFYLFTEQAPPPFEVFRSYHGLDLPFTFNTPQPPIMPNLDTKFVRVIQASWAAFAATGNPDNEFIPHWEKYSKNNRQTMELNSKGCACHKDVNTQNLNDLRYVYES